MSTTSKSVQSEAFNFRLVARLQALARGSRAAEGAAGNSWPSHRRQWMLERLGLTPIRTSFVQKSVFNGKVN